MARYFFALKFRLIRNGLRGSPARLLGFLGGSLFALWLAFVGFAALAAPSLANGGRESLPVLGFTALLVAWIVVPLFGYGLDETLDPGRLALLPLSRRGLMTGLLFASSVGIAPVATFLGLSGAFVGYGRLDLRLPVIAAAILVEFASCLVAARACSTALSRLMRSRRARDVMIVIFSLLGATVGLLAQVTKLVSGSHFSSPALRRLAGVVRWSPPGFAGRAVFHAGEGRVGLALVDLIPALAFAIVLMWWWATNLDRLFTTAEPTPARRRRAAGAGATRPALFPRVSSFLPPNRVGAVAAKELRYLWREPMQRAQRLSSTVFAIVAAIGLTVVPNLHDPRVVLASAAFVWWLSIGSLNQYSMDRAAYWMNVVAAGDPRAELIGKNIAMALVNLPVFLFVAVAAAAIAHGWAYLPLATCLGVAALGVELGLGNVTSVRLPLPMPESTSNMWAGRTGRGCGTVLLMMIVLLVDIVLISPVVGLIAAGLRVWRPLLFVAAPVSIAYGALLYWIGLEIASRWLRGHQPELLEALSLRRTA